MKKNKLLESIIKSCEDTKAQDIVILDMENITPVADYFVITEASNERQVQAIARAIKKDLEAIDLTVTRMEGFNEGRWILVDANEVICHIFHSDERGFYNLERLWGDAKEVEMKDIR